MVAAFAAAVTLGLLATWSAGSIVPRAAPLLLLTTVLAYGTMFLGTIVAQFHRKQRPGGANLAIALNCAAFFITLATILQVRNHALLRALGLN